MTGPVGAVRLEEDLSLGADFRRTAPASHRGILAISGQIMRGGAWTIGFGTPCRDPEHDTGKCRDYEKQACHIRRLAVPVVSE